MAVAGVRGSDENADPIESGVKGGRGERGETATDADPSDDAGADFGNIGDSGPVDDVGLGPFPATPVSVLELGL